MVIIFPLVIIAYFPHNNDMNNIVGIHGKITVIIIEGSLEVKLPTIWADGKAEVGRGREDKRRREKITQ